MTENRGTPAAWISPPGSALLFLLVAAQVIVSIFAWYVSVFAAMPIAACSTGGCATGLAGVASFVPYFSIPIAIVVAGILSLRARGTGVRGLRGPLVGIGIVVLGMVVNVVMDAIAFGGAA